MSGVARYRIPPGRIAHETLDGEVVILDQESGTYFSLEGAGADIWELLALGTTREAIGAFCAAVFEDVAELDASVRGLLDELVAERLIDVVEADAASGGVSAAGGVGATVGERRAWVAPRLERFTDLQTLLLLDPIHDVDESGWPRTAP